MAYEFSVKGIKNNPDFINDSTFGQFYSQMHTKDSKFKMMQNTDSSYFVDEGLFCFSKEEIANAKTNLKDNKGNPMKIVFKFPDRYSNGGHCSVYGDSITPEDGFFRSDDEDSDWDVCFYVGMDYCTPNIVIQRTIEQELMSGQLPLFVQTPNGRLNMSTKRDCFNVNP